MKSSGGGAGGGGLSHVERYIHSGGWLRLAWDDNKKDTIQLAAGEILSNFLFTNILSTLQQQRQQQHLTADLIISPPKDRGPCLLACKV